MGDVFDPEQDDSGDLAVSAEVAVWAVDEGVLRLTGYEPPDPLDTLQPERGLSVRIGEPLVHLVRRTAYARERLSPPKRPKTWPFLDDLPRTLTGKVLRDRL